MQKIVNGKIHNRFDFHVLNVETGEEKTYHAYNIILDGYWETLISSSRALFAQISIGRGSSTLDKGRTTLFDQIASIATTGGESEPMLSQPLVGDSILFWGRLSIMERL